jgi:predicted ferric reductase
VGAGSVLVASQFLWIALHEGMIRLHQLYFGPRLGLLGLAASILLLFAPILIGLALIAPGSWVLSDRLVRLKWSEEEIERARLWVESRELNRTALWLLSGFCVCEFVASYLVFNVWKVAHHASIRLFFDSLALLCIPSLVVSAVCDRLRQEAPAQR